MASRYIKSNKYVGVYYSTLQNKDRMYYITYKDNNQKKKWTKIGLKTEGINEAYCHQKRNEIVTKQRLGEELPHIAKRNIKSLNEVAKQFYDEKELHNKQNKKTRARIEKHIEEDLGNIAINKISKDDILRVQKKKISELEQATINFIIGQLSSIFNWSIKNEIINKNPCINVKALKVDNTRLRYLELDEIKLLKEKLIRKKDLYYFVLLALSTGGRLQTICNIKPTDFKDNGTIRLYDFKNESEYYNFIDEKLMIEIKQFIMNINKQENEFLFQTTKIQNYTNQYYYRKLQPVFDELF